MKVILLEGDPALALLKSEVKEAVKEVIEELRIEVQSSTQVSTSSQECQWVDAQKAREILGVGKTKMQEIRDMCPMNGIEISRHGKTFRYYKPSLLNYLDKHRLA